MQAMGKQQGMAAAFFVALAMVMTWPLVMVLPRALAFPGDPYINTWILDWDWYATFHHPLSLFDANVFYPARYSLAYSENLFGIALLLFPLRALGAGPITAYNIALLAGFAVCGFSAFLLGRYLSGSAIAGLCAGIFYAFVPFRFTHLSHVQHVWSGTIPLMLLALLRYRDRPTWKRAAVFGAAFLFNGLVNMHWLLFGTVAIVMTIAILRPRIVPLATALLVASLLLVPFLLPYLSAAKMYGMQRGWRETKGYSARASDWLVSNFHNHVYARLRNPSIDPERWLFPGALALVVSIAAFRTQRRRELALSLAWIALGFFGSLGIHFVLHRYLFRHVPGFRGIRVPARWAMIAYVGLSMSIALSVAALTKRRAWIGGVIAAAFVAELWSGPIRWYMTTPDPPVYEWIRQAKPRALLELPISRDGSDYLSMLRATRHHRPIVNGVSGYAPPDYTRIATMANESPVRPQLMPELRRIGCSHLLVHGDAVDAATRDWVRSEVTNGGLGFVRRFDGGLTGDWMFELGKVSAPSAELDAWLRGDAVYSDATFGTLDYPKPGEVLGRNPLFTGFALSPYGIRQVNLLFNNGLIRVPATLRKGETSLQRYFRWYDATSHPRYDAAFSQRPAGVWPVTDVQVEIVDGRGRKTLLEDRWIEWP
ncbi:MAG: hypothetical protein ABIP63_04750 [Thermoanaerobaculia bacterium]